MRETIYHNCVDEHRTLNLCNDFLKNKIFQFKPWQRHLYLEVPSYVKKFYPNTNFTLTIQENGTLVYTPTEEFYIK